PDLEMLFCILAEEGLLPPFKGGELGVNPQKEIDPAATDRIPAAFGRVLKYVCTAIDAPEPARIFLYEPLAADARMAHMNPSALLVGPELFQSTDTVELGFRLARALSFSNPGRVAASSRPGSELRPYLLSAMTLARRSLITQTQGNP